jgi:hypothetical protein
MHLTKYTNFQKQMLLKDFPLLQCDPRPSSTCVTRFLSFMSSGNSVARPLREEGNNPFQNENKKLMFVLPKLLSPFSKSMQSKTAATPFTPKIGFYFILMQSATSHN